MASAIEKQYPVLPREHRFGLRFCILSVINLIGLAAIGLYYRSISKNRTSANIDSIFWTAFSFMALILLSSFVLFLYRYVQTHAKVTVTKEGLVRHAVFSKKELIVWEEICGASVCQLFSLKAQPQTPPVIEFYRSAEIAEKAKKEEPKYGAPYGCFPSVLLSRRKEIITVVCSEDAKDCVRTYCPRLFAEQTEEIE